MTFSGEAMLDLTMTIVGIYLATYAFTVHRLRKKFTAPYLQLGEPEIFKNSISSFAKVIEFMACRHHRTLGDMTLSIVSDTCIVSLFVGVILIFFYLIPDVVGRSGAHSGAVTCAHQTHPPATHQPNLREAYRF